MNTWLIASALEVSRTWKAKRVIFIDDRSWATDEASSYVRISQLWASWPDMMGTKENMGKVQFCQKRKKGRGQLLRAGATQESMKETFYVLGTSLDGAKAREDAAKVVARVDAGVGIARQIASTPTTMSIRLRVLAATTVANKARGWLVRDITTMSEEKFGKAIRQAAKDKGSGQGYRE